MYRFRARIGHGVDWSDVKQGQTAEREHAGRGRTLRAPRGANPDDAATVASQWVEEKTDPAAVAALARRLRDDDLDDPWHRRDDDVDDLREPDPGGGDGKARASNPKTREP
jgi:hypothetical protein